ncbi:MAG: type II toxin-antitoxin system HicA family toxin [Bacteroidaceae bacterium]|nr:type II toxin-antitoxin system HicA family toxin [Bacteroidaceae bacterium]
MKGSELKRLLRKGGCFFVAHGTNHDWWSNPQGIRTQVPRHDTQEVNIKTCRSIIKTLLG